jgi:hypothetical protein
LISDEPYPIATLVSVEITAGQRHITAIDRSDSLTALSGGKNAVADEWVCTGSRGDTAAFRPAITKEGAALDFRRAIGSGQPASPRCGATCNDRPGDFNIRAKSEVDCTSRLLGDVSSE